MIEFGEKLKQIREEKGMTQQTLAEHLYVTRQAVSRWECGARYPDLLTAKRIAEILDTTIDELVSGEEGKDSAQREPLLVGAKYRVLQIVLYVMGVIPFLLMTIFSIKSFFPEKSLQGTPAGEVTVLTTVIFVQYLAVTIALGVGLYFALKNRLTPARIGIIIGIPFLAEAIEYGVQNWQDAVWPGLAALCILCFFHGKGCRNRFTQILLPVVIGWVSIHRLYIIFLACRKLMLHYTDLGFVVRTVHVLGEMILVVLLFVQTLALVRKRAKQN